MHHEASVPAIILFDGVCNLCNGAVNFILKRDTSEHFRFVTAQSPLADQLMSQYGITASLDDTFVLIDGPEVFYRSDAAFRIAGRLGPPWRWLPLLGWLPVEFRDWVYSVIARNRYRWFGRRQVCMLPGDEVRHRFLTEVADSI